MHNFIKCTIFLGFPGGSVVRNLCAIQETQVLSLGQEDPLEKGMATHSSILDWRIPWTEEPGGLPSMGSQRVRHDWVINTFTSLQRLKCPRRVKPVVNAQWMLCQQKRDWSDHASLLNGLQEARQASSAFWCPWTLPWENPVLGSPSSQRKETDGVHLNYYDSSPCPVFYTSFLGICIYLSMYLEVELH